MTSQFLFALLAQMDGINAFLLVSATGSFAFSLYLIYRIKRLKEERNSAYEEHENKSKILFLQSRYASMGETIGNIAHQWKQPLNAIGSIQNSIKASLIFQGEISKEKLLDSVETSFKLLQHLGETIDTFYSFLAQQYSPEKSFTVAEELEKIRKITEYSFENNHIDLHFFLDINPTIQGNANEFAHAILNLVLNAKDAFDGIKNDEPAIIVHVRGGKEKCTITVSDNAGGIRIEPIETVFERHISSKEHGSGLGLYMTKNIIEKRFGGKISVKNTKDGACFAIELPYAEYNEQYESLTQDEKLTLDRINELSRKVIELEEIEKTLRKWSDIFKKAHWAIAMHIGTSNRFDLINDAFHTLYGYSAEEMRQLSVPDLFTAESLPILPLIQKEAFEKGYVAFESIHKRRDGSTFPVSVELIAVKDDEGEILYHMANIWDMSEKKASEERLLLKKFALDHIKDAVFLIDEYAQFQYVNEGACRALGYTAEEMKTMRVEDVDPDWPSERWPEHWEALKRSGSMTMEVRHRRKDSTIFPVEVSANFIEYNGKHYNIAIARDITERLRLEEQKDNDRLRLFFERQVIGMAITSPQKGWLKTNRKIEEMLGYTFDELSRMSWADVTHPDDLAEDVGQFELLLRGEVNDYMMEKRYIRKDGSILYVKLGVSCVRKEDGTVDYVLALLEDITERKRIEEEIRNLNATLEQRVLERTAQLEKAVTTLHNEIKERLEIENALRQSEEAFRAMVENSPDTISRYDLEGRRIYVNPMMRFLLNKPLNEILGKTPREYSPLPDIDTFEQDFAIVVREGREMEREGSYRAPDGEIRWGNQRIVPEFDKDGKVASVMVIGRDMTERFETEKRLLLVDTAVNSSTEAIYINDTTLSIIYVNDGACRMLGYSREEMLGMKIYELNAVEACGILEKTTTFNTKHRGKDGRLLDVEITVTPFNFGQEHLRLSLVKDISERKRLEETLHFREQYQRTLLDNFPYFVWLKDQESRLLAANQQYARVAKVVSTADLEGKTDFDFFPAELAQKYVTDDRTVMQEGISKNVEEQYVDEKDEIHWMETWKSPVWVNGKIVGTVGCSRDITERKIMDKALKESEARYREIFENTSDALYLLEVTQEGRYRNLAFNKAFEISTGIPREALVGTYVDEFGDPESTARSIAKYNRCIAAGESIEETAELNLPGGRKTYRSTLIPIKNENGRIVRIIGLAREMK